MIKSYLKFFNRTYPLLIVLSSGVMFVFALLLTIGVSQNIIVILSYVLPVVINLVNVIGLLAASLFAKTYSLRSARVYRIWFFAFLAVLLGDFSWCIFPLIQPGSVSPLSSGFVDALYLFFHPLIFIGGFIIPQVKLKQSDWIKRILESLIIISSVFLTYWVFLIGPALKQNIQSLPSDPSLFYIYMVFSSMLIVVVLRFIDCDFTQFSELSILFFAGSIITYIVCDGIYGYFLMLNVEVANGWLDFGWTFAYFLAAVASLTQYHMDHQPGMFVKAYQPLRKFVRILISAFPYLPFVMLFSAYFFLVQAHDFEDASTFNIISIFVGGIILMVLARLIIEYADNRRLNNSLGQSLFSLEIQQVELSRANEELRVENQERRQVEGRLAFNAMHDWLTGLPNRVLFLDRLTQAIEYCHRSNDMCFSVMFLDLDQFKIINDSMGHDTGDTLLIAVGKKLSKCIRNSDTLARLGGDEFVFLLENTPDDESINLVINRIYEELAIPLQLHDQLTYVTASIGIVRDITEYKLADDILRDADIAMYRAKELGKSQAAYFEPNLRSRAISRLEVENDLRTALKENQFFLNYQPIVSIGENAPVGFEALVRWMHPTRGIVPPNDFIQIAEETGLILPLGEWVLREACWQLVRWQKKLPNMKDLFINVNISGKQFAFAGFVELLEKILAETKLDPHSLKLEITESVLIENIGTAAAIFTYLEKLGIQFEIDDFGTGYSSISYLQHLPIHTIKIDKTFVHDVSEGSKGIELIQAMIAMAENLGMETIAEGVETNEQLAKLTDLNCSFVQGYLLSRPMDRLDATEYLRKSMGQEDIL
jgi:diguanylate cyclase (GGDEF)-like protein